MNELATRVKGAGLFAMGAWKRLFHAPAFPFSRKNLNAVHGTLVLLAALPFLFTGGCNLPGLTDMGGGTASYPTRILTSYAPVAGITKDITGGAFDVDSLAPFHQGPESFDIQADRNYHEQSVQRADVFIALGLDADRQLVRFVQDIRMDIPRFNVADAPTLQLRPWPRMNTGAKVKASARWRENPYVWLSIPNALAMSKEIEKQLSRLVPDKSDSFRDRLERFTASLKDLQQNTAMRVAALPERRVSLTTPRLEYLAADMGLDLSSTVSYDEWSSACSASDPEAFRKTVERLAADGVAAVIADNGCYPSEPLVSVLRAYDIKLAMVSSFEHGGNLLTVVGGFEGMMKENHETILEALGAPASAEIAALPENDSLTDFLRVSESSARPLNRRGETASDTGRAGTAGTGKKSPETMTDETGKETGSGVAENHVEASPPSLPEYLFRGQNTPAAVEGIFAPVMK